MSDAFRVTLPGCGQLHLEDLYCEADAQGIALSDVTVEVDGDFPGVGAPSTPITVTVDLTGDVPVERLRALLDHVAEIAEIPLSMRIRRR